MMKQILQSYKKFTSLTLYLSKMHLIFSSAHNETMKLVWDKKNSLENIVWPTGTSWRISVSYEFQGFATKDFKKAKEYKQKES